MKRAFTIEVADDYGPMWMNASNLMMCLTSYCKNTKFTVRDITNRPEEATIEGADTAGEPEVTAGEDK